MKLLHRTLRSLWYLCAATILLLAVVVALARALLPHVKEYRIALEGRLSSYVGQPVTIERLDAHLIGISPSLIFRNVALKSGDGRETLARFGEIRIGLDLLASLRQGQPVFHELRVAGANIVLVRRNDGSFSVEGLVALEQRSGSAQQGSLGEWLFSQGRLAVRDSAVVWRDEQRRQTLRFAHVDMELYNSGERHRLNAALSLPEGSGKALKISVDIRGNPLLSHQWRGAVYMRAEAIHPDRWLPLITLQLPQHPFSSGEVSCELWSDWQEGLPVALQGSFSITNALLHNEGREDAHLNHLSGEFRWQNSGAGWVLDLQRLLLADAASTPIRLHLEHDETRDLLLVDQLQLAEFATLTSQLPMLPEQAAEWVQQLAPRGMVKNVRFEHGANGRFAGQGEFAGVGVQAWQYLPGITNASGRWRFDNGGAELALDAHDVGFDAPHLFRQPLSITTLAALVTVRPLEAGWLVAGQEVTAANSDITARGDFEMQFEVGRKPYLDLRFGYSNGSAAQVPRYIPAHIMGESVVAWLDGAFRAGRVSGGTLLYHGRSGDFPFNEQNGLFETRFDTEEVELAFHEGWPHLQSLDGEVRFENKQMVITPRHARLFDTTIDQASVTIEDLGEPLLAVDIAASPPAGDVLRLLRETPLAEHVGSALEPMAAEGKSSLQLSIKLPLAERVGLRRPLSYRGEVSLRDARLQVWPGVVFNQLNGKVAFSDSAFESMGLTGELYEAPARVTIHTDANRRTVVSGEGRANAAALRRELKQPLLEHLQGESGWHAQIFLPRGEGSHVSMELSSSLAGVTLDLPAPFNKGGQEAVPLFVRLAFGEEASKRLSLAFGERFSAQFLFGGEPNELQRGALHFGSGNAELPKEKGWRITGSQERLDWQRWHELLPSRDEAAPPLPVEIDMGRLTLLATSSKQTAAAQPLRAEQVPPLQLHVRDLVYDQWHFGEVTGSSRSDSDSWEVPQLHMVAPDHAITLAGRWQRGAMSRCDFNLRAANVEQLLRSFGYAPMINGATAHLSGTLSWPGHLAEPAWGALDGKIAVEIKDGSLVELDPGAGRLFGLLSLQALPRRLTLDFRDLFQKGMQFDEIKGDIRIKEGNAVSNNLYLKSPSAGILMEGRTGLVRRDYDQTISVVPNVSGSISIASALAWGPQAAAAVLLLQRIFKENIAEATMIRYSLTGPWESPQIKRLEGAAAKQGK